jgi:HSP20 family protein
MLGIKGQRKVEHEEVSTDKKTHYSERFYGSFMRTIPFAEDIMEEKIDAEYTNGMLKVKLPKKPTDSPVNRKISIKT